MLRYAVALAGVGLIGGCMSVQHGPEPGGSQVAHYGQRGAPPIVPGVQGAYGTDVPMAAPYNSAPPPNAEAARRMMAMSLPLNMVQFSNGNPGMPGPQGMTPPGGVISPVGIPGMPGMPGMQGGGQNPMMPVNFAAGDPMRGVVNANIPPGAMPPGGIVPAQAMMPGGPKMMNPMAGMMAAALPGGAAQAPPPGMRFPVARTQIRFVRPSGMKIAWFAQGPDGSPMYSANPIEAPGRYNFLQAAIYRLKLSNIEGRPGLEVYPTMEVVPCNPRTEAFLSHSAVPIEFTNEDFRQVAEGNYLVKVIYLPDPQYQDLAGTGTDEILSTRLEPGVDPIQEALRRGSILLVIRMGNVDQEAPNTPALNAPPAGQAAPQMPPMGMMPGQAPPPNVQVPYLNMRSAANPSAPGGAPNLPPGQASTGPIGMPGPFLGNQPGLNTPALSIPGAGSTAALPPSSVPPATTKPAQAPTASTMPPSLAPKAPTATAPVMPPLPPATKASESAIMPAGPSIPDFAPPPPSYMPSEPTTAPPVPTFPEFTPNLPGFPGLETNLPEPPSVPQP